MILGAEIALFVMGVYALVTGKLLHSKNATTTVRGWPARVIGIICLLPIPVAFAVSAVVAAVFVMQGKPVTQDSFFWVGTGIEAGVLVLCVIAMTILTYVYQTPND